MAIMTVGSILSVLVSCIFTAALIYLFVLLVKALRKYLAAAPVRAEKEELKRSLGETIRDFRQRRGMTQEFVAESLGVSRQAVSKWESGRSDPSTSNLLALSRLFGVSPEELLQRVDGTPSQED